jgi:K+ transporter
MNNSHKDLHTKWTLGGLLISLGIIYGDIGTSPLYVMKAILGVILLVQILFWEEFQLYFGHLLYLPPSNM